MIVLALIIMTHYKYDSDENEEIKDVFGLGINNKSFLIKINREINDYYKSQWMFKSFIDMYD